ncbi:uncharacterized protein LOC123510638 isoform X2 [Portunus trituberculatus]|uniref:uncharacterized protein LOC123510638 isoform X2 n=1 Tax=Portunus trituberculatus TaxID=210409 RepID=UPI001E1D1190|nr:uncharacterized protein LOC123510638 isoform X2 [Portunus trituberculatus]
MGSSNFSTPGEKNTYLQKSDRKVLMMTMMTSRAAEIWACHVIFLLFLTLRGEALRISGMEVPRVVVSGSSVQLVCNYEYNREREDPLYSVKWYRNVNQFYEYIPKREPQVRVYPLPNLNVDERGSTQATVLLKGVTRASSGTFRCEVMGDKPLFETDDKAKNMTVVDIPAWGPELTGVIHKGIGGVGEMGGGGRGEQATREDVTQGSRVRPGDVMSVRCLLGHSDPQAVVTWLVNSRPPPPPHTHLRVLTNSDEENGQRIQISELEAVVTEAWFVRGALSLTCHARVSTVYHSNATITLLHADHPKPAGFGWFSAASTPQDSLLLHLLLPLLFLL